MSTDTTIEDATGEPFVCGEIHFETVTCFICGSQDCEAGRRYELYSLTSPVADFPTGRRIQRMFNCGARFDYNPRRPELARIIIGACDRHKYKLEKLRKMTRDGKISVEKINEARKG